MAGAQGVRAGRCRALLSCGLIHTHAARDIIIAASTEEGQGVSDRDLREHHGTTRLQIHIFRDNGQPRIRFVVNEGGADASFLTKPGIELLPKITAFNAKAVELDPNVVPSVHVDPEDDEELLELADMALAVVQPAE